MSTMDKITSLVLMPRESGKFIAQSASNVFVKTEGVKELASEILENLKNGRISIKNFSQHSLHPSPHDRKVFDWLLVLDSLNFCFWSDKALLPKKWKVNGQSGYFALCAAIKRAVEEGVPITDAAFLSKVTEEEVRRILRPDEDSAETPLMKKRVENLNEIGRVLLDKYNGTFKECVKACNNSAEKLLKFIVTDFPCFRDEAVYKNQRVSFYKRAQILIGDIWACFNGKDLGEFKDIDYITMFPDYRVPQVLLHYGTMEYSHSLMEKLLSEDELPHGSEEEIEIRGCSIEAVERVVKETRYLIENDTTSDLRGLDCNSILVDHFLWDYRRKYAKELETVPYHKTRTIFY
ncbi:queuosine 5'-phosphate N-glycosylase/hydrolase [Phymastichus coffea]|uniref:queuosine 5'-phosphate N-glycosylase/hydrolase n=1 Tax=Phymastichus coffea TaxID=108790 RepID=UPI00273B10C9|nr:queuosine 5'-phosphate N-glycosylase/hydrolase [Phymastichus coffea]